MSVGHRNLKNFLGRILQNIDYNLTVLTWVNHAKIFSHGKKYFEIKTLELRFYYLDKNLRSSKNLSRWEIVTISYFRWFILKVKKS